MLKASNVIRPTNKKSLLKNFGDYCYKQSNVSSLPDFFTYLFAVFTENGVDAFLKMLTLSEKVQKDKIDLLGEEEDEAKLFLQIAGDVILAKDIEYTWI